MEGQALKRVFRPMGARILVQEIVTTLSIEERGRRAGIEVITESDNRPRPTMGRVIAIGTDPILKETGIQIGDIVHYGPHAGYIESIEDQDFKMLMWEEVTALEQLEAAPQSPSPDSAPDQERSTHAVSSVDQPSPE